ncbi:hypothetical protein BDV95DRAFT_603487 [Massariosphaeria phaeospora]|uniref:Uncharacterized protein n=1 Tax=Massariosphaeria phaeospora TaxID=100035 RepID=A0A7C8ICM4_9PLEO|nr:hypothetical protein BDV95DRAFT_603487 [Massariosphaeria phaeospora]
MTTPISLDTTTTTTTTASSTSPPPSHPISPISRSGSFPHKTSLAVATTRPFIEMDTPAINADPVELDGATAASLGDEPGRGAKGGSVKRTEDGEGVMISPGLGESDDVDEEFLGEGGRGAGREVREKRAAVLATRSKDPSVIVDVPQEPTAEEVEAAKSADGTVTPAVG